LKQALHRTTGTQLDHESERGVQHDDYADGTSFDAVAEQERHCGSPDQQ
jgi:hypothetical protein